VSWDGAPVDLGGRRPATVLACLALAAGRPVGVERLIDLVWGDDPPPSARRTLQSYVAGLRGVLGGTNGPIGRRGAGYVADVDRTQVDLLLLEDLIGTAHERAADEPDEVIRQLRDALASWGPPLEGLDASPPLCAVVAPYEELRAEALELLNDLELEHGQAAGAVARLSSLTREFPLRERFWSQLVRGLTMLGRRDQAMSTIQRAREVLREELGVDPGPGLTSAERALLAGGDEHLTVAAIVTAGRADSTAVQIPLPSSELVGRHHELRRVTADLERHRLLTLTGTGGVGKTRLAIEVARAARSGFSDGVWYVELAPVSDPAAVAGAFASALSVGTQHGESTESAIVGRLQGRRALVVVDNCEHVTSASASLIAAIARSCATVTVLATSRQPLGVVGERVHVVAPLDPASEGVALFLACASAADASFTPVEVDVSEIAEICRRLGGIPLGIQLAASRIRALTPGDLLTHLDDRFGLLRGDSDATSRHHTIRATVDWSYQLLSPQEQLAFDRTSVFAGGFDLVAAESVCVGGDLPAEAIAHVVGSLVDKSMIHAEREPPGVRYRLLEPVRQYGAESLAARGETSTVRARFLEHYRQLAVSTRALWLGPTQGDAEEIFTREWSNLRAALDAAISTRTAAAADSIIDAVAPHAWTRIEYEHGEWARRVLDLATLDCDISASTYGWAAYWTFLAGGPHEARDLAQRGIAAASEPTHPSTAWCWATDTWALLSAGIGGPDSATAAANAELAARDSDGFDRFGALSALIEAGISHAAPETRTYVDRCGCLAREIGAPTLLARVAIYGTHGDPLVIHRAGVELARSVGDVNNEGKHLLMIASHAMRERRPDAGTLACEVLDRLYRTRHWTVIWMLVDYVTEWMAATGRDQAAAVVLGYLEAHRPSWHAPPTRLARSRALEAIRTLVAADELMSRGAAMGRDEIVEFVLHADARSERRPVR
jgi:predicted ATPase/DNA-binding SARP family transcriptional activator